MKAIILAAGRGSRMGSLTTDAPKCLTMLGGRTLLDWQILALKAAGAEDIAVVRGYLGDKLNQPRLHYFENPRWQTTNMVRSLQAAEEWLSQEECLVSYSDIVYSPAAAQCLVASRGSIAIAYDPDWLGLWKKRFADPLSDAETFRCDSDGTLTEIGTRAQSVQQIRGQYMGLLKFSPEGWKEVEAYLGTLKEHEADLLDMTSTLKSLIERGVRVQSQPIKGGWYEVDSESDLRLYEQEVRNGTSWLNALQ